MNTSIVLALDNRYKKEDGTYPIVLRIIHFGKSCQIGTKIYVSEKDWDDKKRVIKNSFKGSESVTRLNNFLQKKKAEVLDIVTGLEEEGKLQYFTITQLKKAIENKKEIITLKSYTQKIIDEFYSMKKIGNAKIYKYTLNNILAFNKQHDINLNAITYQFLKEYETYFLSKGNSLNGLAVIMRTLRAIINRAIKEGILDKSNYPFNTYSIKSQKTRKRAITIDAIQRIIDLSFDATHPLYHARNYFLASFYMRGIPFADLSQLSLENIINGRIVYHRKKTAKPYNVKISEDLQVILDIYTANKKDKTDYIFPIIKTKEKTEKQYNEVAGARKRYNKKLKLIAQLCNIEDNLTSYVSRHSFATQAKNLGVPIATISDMLGHENIKTTEVYLDSLPNNLMDEFHMQVIKQKKNTSKNKKQSK